MSMQNIPVMDCGDGVVRAATGVNKVPVAKTASYTIKHSEAGTTFTNRGAGGAVTFTLPATDTTNYPNKRITGARFRFVKHADQNLIIAVPTGATINNGTASTGVFRNVTSLSTNWPACEIEAISETEWVVLASRPEAAWVNA